MTHGGPQPVGGVMDDPGTDLHQARGVLTNPRFMALFLSQLLTQVGGNMVLFGLTVHVSDLTNSTTSVSILLLTFLVPAVAFGAIAGVFVDRYDRRRILVWTNVARGLLFLLLILLDQHIVALFLITAIVATLTTFFAPAETAMIPLVVKRDQLLTANGLFVLGLQASFALGFAVLGPLVLKLTGVQVLIGVVAGTYLLAGLLCWTLPPAPAPLGSGTGGTISQAGAAIRATLSQLRDGLVYIGQHRPVFWALAYLTITSSLIGVLGVLGPAFAKNVLGLDSDDFWVIVLPLGVGLVGGIVVLHFFGRLMARKWLIEIGLTILAVSLLLLGGAQSLGLPADGPLTLTRTGPYADQELRSQGPGVAWAACIGRRAEDGDFAEFCRRLAERPPHANGTQVVWTDLDGCTLAFGWDGPLTVDGRPQDWDHFPHYANRYTDTPPGAAQMIIRHAGQALALDL